MNQRLTTLCITTLSLGTTLLAAAQAVNALCLDLLTKGTEANGAVVASFDAGLPGNDRCLRGR